MSRLTELQNRVLATAEQLENHDGIENLSELMKMLAQLLRADVEASKCPPTLPTGERPLGPRTTLSLPTNLWNAGPDPMPPDDEHSWQLIATTTITISGYDHLVWTWIPKPPPR